MIGILIVAHSERLASGVKEFAEQATHGQVPIVAVGGAVDGSLGISPEAIREGLRRVAGNDGVLVLVDFTSAALSVEAVLEDEATMRVVISNAPLVEGAYLAAVEASVGATLEEAAAAALRGRDLIKVQSDCRMRYQ
ncbi:PTS-dependent dihydroxyacetone kinase phosphotransferase subunit DhaM [Roseiflexus sp.]|uniref:PTS-dependent dihydroxyacetone kinase phosphotransferase subunit DhaM n=1 Tax=Roseiflexus sp. TaxID=2562120 RepID=UPI0021DC173E|nr:PTS mannose transporter subunit IID [Roseiflexus sp.]GIW03034.1 MAG: PTS mannose transporter subunit IID [Roseiflexus sp.]